MIERNKKKDMMASRMRGNSHVRFRAGEKMEIASKSYLSLLLKVKVDIRFPDLMAKIFKLENNECIPYDEKLKVYIYKDDMRIRDDFNVNKYSTRTFWVEGEDGNLVEINSPVNLFLPDREVQDFDKFYDEDEERFVFSFEDIKTYQAPHMFHMIIRNTGIADPLLAIKDGLDKNYSMRDVHNYQYSPFTQDLFDKVVHSGIKVRGVHLEIILSSMIFFDETLDEGQCIFYNINDAIYHSPSPVKSIIYQQGTKQLTTDSFNDLFVKEGSSEFDRLILPDLVYGKK